MVLTKWLFNEGLINKVRLPPVKIEEKAIKNKMDAKCEWKQHGCLIMASNIGKNSFFIFSRVRKRST